MRPFVEAMQSLDTENAAAWGKTERNQKWLT